MSIRMSANSALNAPSLSFEGNTLFERGESDDNS